MLLLVACAPKVDLSIDPESLDFGDVEIGAEVPDGGFAEEDVVITNEGDAAVTLVLEAYSTEHLCVSGLDGSVATELPEMSAGASYTLRVGVCGYAQGEEGSVLHEPLTISTGGDPATYSVDVSYTPIRVSG